MAAIFFMADDQVYTISNEMSVFKAGFRFVKEYYNKYGKTLTYYIRDDGQVLERISQRRRQTINHVFANTQEANDRFRMLQSDPHVVNGKIDYSEKRTWETGKWIPKKR